MDGIVNYFKQVRDKVVREHDDQVFSDGFNEAANLCVELLSARTDDLLRKMKAGELSSEEQKVFAELSELRAEMVNRPDFRSVLQARMEHDEQEVFAGDA